MWRFDSLRKYDAEHGTSIRCFCDTGWGIAFSNLYSNTHIKIVSYWGETADHEFGIHNDSIYPNMYIASDYVFNDLSPGNTSDESHYANVNSVIPLNHHGVIEPTFDAKYNGTSLSKGVDYVLDADAGTFKLKRAQAQPPEGPWLFTFDYSYESKEISHWKNMPVVKELSIPTGFSKSHLCFWENRLYIFGGTSQESQSGDDDIIFKAMIVNPWTGEIIEEKHLGDSFVCKPQILNNKIWLTTRATRGDIDDPQYLVALHPTTFNELLRVEIPARKQQRAHRFVLVNNLLITDLYNDNSIACFDSNSGQHVSTIFVNRKPLSMFYNDDNKLIVGSYLGMISEVDLTSGDVVHIGSSGSEATGGVIDDGRYIWVGTSGGLSRFDKTLEEENFISQTETASSSAIAQSKFLSLNIDEILLSRPFKYQVWDGDSFVERERAGYMLVRTNKQVFAIRNVPMWREYYNQVLGTAMISTGETTYYGETE